MLPNHIFPIQSTDFLLFPPKIPFSFSRTRQKRSNEKPLFSTALKGKRQLRNEIEEKRKKENWSGGSKGWKRVGRKWYEGGGRIEDLKRNSTTDSIVGLLAARPQNIAWYIPPPPPPPPPPPTPIKNHL